MGRHRWDRDARAEVEGGALGERDRLLDGSATSSWAVPSARCRAAPRAKPVRPRAPDRRSARRPRSCPTRPGWARPPGTGALVRDRRRAVPSNRSDSPRHGDPNEHLARPRLGLRPLEQLQYVRATRLAVDDRSHAETRRSKDGARDVIGEAPWRGSPRRATRRPRSRRRRSSRASFGSPSPPSTAGRRLEPQPTGRLDFLPSATRRWKTSRRTPDSPRRVHDQMSDRPACPGTSNTSWPSITRRA